MNPIQRWMLGGGDPNMVVNDVDGFPEIVDRPVPSVKAQNKAAKNAFTDVYGDKKISQWDMEGKLNVPDNEIPQAIRQVGRQNAQRPTRYPLSPRQSATLGPIGKLPAIAGALLGGGAILANPTIGQAAEVAAGFTPANPIANWLNPQTLNDMDEEYAIRNFGR